MRVLDSNVFNETLSRLLLKLKRDIDNISPEHIKYLPVELVDASRKYLDGEYRFDNLANINGVDGYKLNSLAYTIKSLLYEYKEISQTFRVHGKYGNGKKVSLYGKIDVPSGWDGRNGFFYFTNDMLFDVTATNSHSRRGFVCNITQNETLVDVHLFLPDSDGCQVPRKVEVKGLLWRNTNVK